MSTSKERQFLRSALDGWLLVPSGTRRGSSRGVHPARAAGAPLWRPLPPSLRKSLARRLQERRARPCRFSARRHEHRSRESRRGNQASPKRTATPRPIVRWLTLFGHGFVELGRPEQAFDFYERALEVARSVPELQMPFMTLVGKADALVKVGRVSEAEVAAIRGPAPVIHEPSWRNGRLCSATFRRADDGGCVELQRPRLLV